jgi:hypothetical protein
MQAATRLPSAPTTVCQIEVESALGLPPVAVDLLDHLNEQLLLAAEIVID